MNEPPLVEGHRIAAMTFRGDSPLGGVKPGGRV